MPDTNGMALIEAERKRQVDVEGWTAAHDDAAHDLGELLDAARCYLEADGPDAVQPTGWPWDAAWWKPRDRARNLIRAGALMLAERDRLGRMLANARPTDGAHWRKYVRGRLEAIRDELVSVAATLDALNGSGAER